MSELPRREKLLKHVREEFDDLAVHIQTCRLHSYIENSLDYLIELMVRSTKEIPAGPTLDRIGKELYQLAEHREHKTQFEYIDDCHKDIIHLLSMIIMELFIEEEKEHAA